MSLNTPNPTEAEIAAIDTSKIPRVCGLPSPQNKAEFLALLAEAEQQIENGQYYTFDEVFDKLNAKYHFKKLMDGEQQIREGKGIPAEEVFAELNAKYRSKK